MTALLFAQFVGIHAIAAFLMALVITRLDPRSGGRVQFGDALLGSFVIVGCATLISLPITCALILISSWAGS